MYVRDPLGSLCERLRESLYPLQQKHWKKPAGQGILNTLTSKKWGGYQNLLFRVQIKVDSDWNTEWAGWWSEEDLRDCRLIRDDRVAIRVGEKFWMNNWNDGRLYKAERVL